MNIDRFLKRNKILVVELDDEVEYLIDDQAADKIRRGQQFVFVTRVIDRVHRRVSVKRIFWALSMNGPLDYLDKPQAGRK